MANDECLASFICKLELSGGQELDQIHKKLGHVSEDHIPPHSVDDCVRWLPKSPKLHGSHNWNSQGSHWASLKGRENIQGSKLYKFSSVNENWKEGRISPEQEAERLEDPDEDEPISKFSGSLFSTSESIRGQSNARTPLGQERQKIPTKSKHCPSTNHKQQVANHVATEGKKALKQSEDRIPGSSEAAQPLLKVPVESGFLKFTFVPSLGRLPTQCYLADCTTFNNEVIAETKEVEKSSAIGSGNKRTGEAASCLNDKHRLFEFQEDKAKGGTMDGKDLFRAEFVLITDSDDDTQAILGNGYGHESSEGLAVFHMPSGDECKGQENAPQMPQHPDLHCSSASSQEPTQLTSPLSASDHLSHKSPAAPLLSPTNLKVEHGLAVPGHQASSHQESHSQWRSANGSCIQQTSTYFQSTTSSSLPSSTTKVLPSSFEGLVDHDRLPHNVQSHKPEMEPTSLSPPLSEDSGLPSRVVTSADGLQGSSPRSYSPLPPKKLGPWAQVPIHITTHVLSPSPTQLPPSLHGSSSNIYNVSSHCSQMPFGGSPPVSRVKSPLPARLSLLTAILKSGSSPKRPFSPASCPGTFSPSSFDSSTLATEQKFKTTSPTKASSHFSILRSDSPYQDEGHFSGLSNAPRSRMVSSRSSPTLQTWSLFPKKSLDIGACSPDKLRPLSPIISSYRKTVVSPLLKPKVRTFSLPPLASRQRVLKTREPEKSSKVRTCSPTFVAKSHQAPILAVNQRPTVSPTAQKLSYSPFPNQPKEHLLRVSAKDRGTNLSTPFYHQDLPSSIPPGCDINSPLLQTNASSPLHSNFRTCSPCSRNKSPPVITPYGSLARKHSPCPQLSRSRETSSPLSFSLPADCENKTPQSYKINASYKAFAAIPTNTLLLEQKALDEQTKAELEVEDRTLDTHSEMCSPAQLRQQTEELCAAIDEVLQEPLARRRCNSSPGSLKSAFNSNAGKMSTVPKRPAGRETKYANLYLTAPAVTDTHKMYIPPFLQELKEAYLQKPCETKPGVIRPTTVKAKVIIAAEEEPVQPNPFRKYLEERSDLQTEQTTHPIVPIPENEALSSKELSSVRRKDKPPYQEDLNEGNFLDTESPHRRGYSALGGNLRNNFAKLS
ncbi:muscular LMNA-interacting protein [Erythrolamprus reginae]|uniref:muscular LMNA-interacting protein n=1 Tax=Erythrolamprus reginae TaxID=121349 RepID=UPI00396C8FBE